MDTPGRLLQDPRLRKEAETESGLRCVGCGRRIEKGFEFIRFVSDVERGELGLRQQRTYACSRLDCEAGDRLKKHADCVKLIEIVWLRGDPTEAKEPAPLKGEPGPLDGGGGGE